MSYAVKNNKIYLTRGDTFIAQVNLEQNGDPYVPEVGDEIRFALKHADMLPDKSDFVDTEPIFTVQIPTDTLTLRIEPEQTKALPFGTYVYDLQITFSDGRVDTFVTNSQFKLTPEVD